MIHKDIEYFLEETEAKLLEILNRLNDDINIEISVIFVNELIDNIRKYKEVNM